MNRGPVAGTRHGAASMPRFLWLAVTSRCNLHCRHCQRDRLVQRGLLESAEMPWSIFERVAAEVLPHLERIQAGGSNFGEQLIHPQWDRMFQRIRKHKLPLAVVTNATTLTPDRLQVMTEAGTEFNFSLEGTDRESYEAVRGFRFERFLRTLELACTMKKAVPDKGSSVNLGFTLWRDNIKQLPALIQMAADLGVDRIVATHFFPWKESQRTLSLVYHKAMTNEMLATARTLARETGIRIDLPAPFAIGAPAAKPAALSSDPLQPCHHPWQSAAIDEAGNVMPCCAASVVMGNLSRQSFAEIWNGPRYRKLRRTVNSSSPPVFCRGCPLRRIDRESSAPISFWSDDAVLLSAIGSGRAGGSPTEKLRTVKTRLAENPWGIKLLPHLVRFYRAHAAHYLTDLSDLMQHPSRNGGSIQRKSRNS